MLYLYFLQLIYFSSLTLYICIYIYRYIYLPIFYCGVFCFGEVKSKDLKVRSSGCYFLSLGKLLEVTFS